MSQKPVKEHSVGVIPVQKNKNQWLVFLIHQKYGTFWGFPKGHLDEGEKLLDGAQRELHEETGLQMVSLLAEAPWSEKYSFHRDTHPVDKQVDYFLMEVEGTLLFQPEEIIDGKWCTFTEAKEKLTYPESKRILEKAFSYLETHFLLD